MMPDYDFDRNDERLDDLEPNGSIHDTSDEVLRIDYLTAIYELAKVYQCQYEDGPAVAEDIMNSDHEDAILGSSACFIWICLTFQTVFFISSTVQGTKRNCVILLSTATKKIDKRCKKSSQLA